MSYKMNLPAELIEVETLLQRFDPIDSAMNRDALMYQAGWAAAETKQSRKQVWIGPASAGAVAASLMIFTILSIYPLQPAKMSSQNLKEPESKQPLTAHMATAKDRTAVPVSTQRLTHFSPAARRLVMRDHALRHEFSDPPLAVFADESTATSTRSHRQLLKEFLPTRARASVLEQRKSRWWSLFHTGGNS